MANSGTESNLPTFYVIDEVLGKQYTKYGINI